MHCYLVVHIASYDGEYNDPYIIKLEHAEWQLIVWSIGVSNQNYDLVFMIIIKSLKQKMSLFRYPRYLICTGRFNSAARAT